MPGIGAAETPAGGPPRPGLKQQFGNTRRAAISLVRAHVDLAKAELGDILSLVKTLGIIAGVAIVVGLFTANLAYVGTWLFLGEWLFGSLGWGLFHGLLFGVGVLTLLGLLFVGAGAGRAITALLLSAVLGILVGVLLWSQVIPRTLDTLTAGTTLPLGLDTSIWVAGGIGAALFALVGLFVGARAGGIGGAITGLIGGALVGLLLGLLLGGRYGARTASAMGVTLTLLLWPVLQVVLSRSAIDTKARFGALKPTETIETAKETKEWLGQQWADRRSKLGKR